MRKNRHIDTYIAQLPGNVQQILMQIRDFIHKTVPNAEEAFSYQVPCVKYHGMLVGFGVNNKGGSFYTMNPKLLDTMEKDLHGYKYSGSTIHIAIGQELPFSLLEKIIRARMKENEMRELARKQPKTTKI